MSDRWNIKYVYLGSVLGFLTGLTLIAMGSTVPGISVMFLSNAVGDTLAPGVAIKANSIAKLNALSAVTTWRDVGTACGSLIGGYVLLQLGVEIVFGMTAAFVSLFALKFVATPVLRVFTRAERV